MFKIKDVDTNIVKNLLHYSDLMAKLYNKLYTLEINGKKDSKEYLEIINLTQCIKNKEKIVYDSIPLQYLQNYFNYFMKIEEKLEDEKLPVQMTLFTENEAYIIFRITNTLNCMLEEMYQYEEEEALEELSDEEYLISLNEFSNLFTQDESILNDMDIDSFHEHILDVSIVFLDELIESITDIKLKNYLKKNKYINAFSNPIIEDEYLLHDMNLNLNMVNKNEYKRKKHILKCAYNSSISFIKDLLKEKTYKDKKAFIINLSILKAYLYYLSDESIVRLINKLYSIKDKNVEKKKVKIKIIQEMKDTLNKISQ